MITYKRFLLDMATERTSDVEDISKIIGDIYNDLYTTDDKKLQDIYTRKLNVYADEIEYCSKIKMLYLKLLDEIEENILEKEFNMKLHKEYVNKFKGE